MNRTVLLADDHPSTLALWRALLEPEFDVVGGVGDGRALVEAYSSLAPDAVVSDIGMPGMNGILAATTILRQHPGARIVLVTVHADHALMRRALAAGAFGYVLKVKGGDDLLPAVRAALRGELFISAFPPIVRERANE